jgi:hypothetical protein
MIERSQLNQLEIDVRMSDLSVDKKTQYLKWLLDMRHVNRALTYRDDLYFALEYYAACLKEIKESLGTLV